MTKRLRTPVREGDPVREEVVNVLLAQLLRDQGFSARAERRSRRGTPDVIVDLRTGDQVLLECKWEGSSRLLEDQLDGRLRDFPEALGVFGVIYPDWIKLLENTLSGLQGTADYEWWLHGSRGEAEPDIQVMSGSLDDLASHIRTLPLELEGVDRVAAAAGVVAYALEQAAARVNRHARMSRLVSEVIAETDQEKDRAAALRIGCLVLFNALAFHDRLATATGELPTIHETFKEGVGGLRRVWTHVCDNIDYVPVFEVAVDILDALELAPREYREPPLAPLVKAVDDTRLLEGHDLSGRLFHTLLTDAKFSGAYYTSVPAATLLSRLVLHDWPPHIDWRDHEFPASLNVADLACGTGTLLMAVAAEAERLHKRAGGENAVELHKAMVEQALHGYDVQLSAVHFAATSLAMLNPDIQFDRMNLYVMPLGSDGDEVSLGSLDFLGEDEVAVQFALSAESMGVSSRRIREAGRVYGGGTRGAAEGVTATLPDLDLAIMNPPFTRSVGGNLLFGSLPQPERRKLQNELSRRIKSRQASSTAGLGPAFVAAVSPKLRPGEGRLALVLPSTVCTGPSWEQTRALIEQEFVLDMVISSHDPLRWHFSDSTDLSEVLLIATRRPKNYTAQEPRTTFVNLWRNPAGVLDAHRIAHAITQTVPAKLEDPGTALLAVDERHVGEVVSIPESRLGGRKWSGVQFSRADLIRSAVKLLSDGEVWVPSEEETASIPQCQLGELGRVGPDRRDVWDGFERTDAVTAYPMVQNHDTEHRRRLSVEPDKYLAPLSAPRGGRRLKPHDQLWRKAGRLLVAERLRLDTARVAAMWSETRVLSNVWWPVQVEDMTAEKALATWLNSSLGLLTLLAERTSTEGSWVAMKKADLEALPVLDVQAVPASQLQALADLFDAMSEEEFERLPGMAHCPARRSLDVGISKILGLPNLGKLRELLASEPVVSNRRL